ncbi:MAG: hypothetical protein HY711_11680, partial [Candidatus Melainabacteria bacterium]|nr:hypothetical protein [Candidatus Melainabacteria bacterium]
MRVLYLYLHTHWDREWYLPLESFRIYLKALMQTVCHELETGSVSSFYLDGQACALEDVVELDPTLAPRIRALMQSGRLYAGPWYVLADQMLVGGESLIANLKLGMKVASQFGVPTMIGYCPDTFGHSQDLPRILAGFGIGEAIVWRGVPPYDGDPVFWWVSPDGTRLLTYHLSCGYYQTIFHDRSSTEALMEKLLPWVEQELLASSSERMFCSLINGALLPVGGDHLFPPKDFQRQIKELRRCLAKSHRGQVEIETVSLQAFLSLVKKAVAAHGTQVKVVSGELRDNNAAQLHARAYLLSGVLSSRLYLKQANRHAEHRLNRIFEPLCVLLRLDKVMQYPGTELEYVWKLLLKNQPHDSICGTSVDDVHDEMMVRMHGVHHALDSIKALAQDSVGRALDKRQDTPQLDYVIDSKARLSVKDPDFLPNRLVVYNMSSQEVSQPVLLSWCCHEDETKQDLNVQVACRTKRNELFYGPELTPYYKEVDLVEGWVWAPHVPSLGFKELEWPSPACSASEFDGVVVKARELNNGLISVKVASDGSIVCKVTQPGVLSRQFKLRHTFRDVGDGGDTYNFDPLPGDKPVFASVSSVTMGHLGPLVGSLLATYSIKIPKCICHNLQDKVKGADDLVVNFERSQELVTHYLTTEISLQKGVSILFFETSWENQAENHRLEVLFDTGVTVEQTYSENHFSLVTRQHLNADGGQITGVERGGGRGELVAAERGCRAEDIESRKSSEQERHVQSQRASFTPGGAAESGDGGLN